MSIPERLWRVVKGQWALAEERAELTRDHADAMQELAEALRRPTPASAEPRLSAAGTPVLPHPAPVTAAGYHDPLEACYELLGIQPGAGLAEVQAAYDRQSASIHPEHYAAGSHERAAMEARRSAVTAAYERLRDSLNPTETRFEHLEF